MKYAHYVFHFLFVNTVVGSGIVSIGPTACIYSHIRSFGTLLVKKITTRVQKGDDFFTNFSSVSVTELHETSV